MTRARAGNWLQQAGVAVGFLLLWEAAVRAFEVPKFLVPSPVDVVESIWLGFKSGVFIKHGFYTLSATLIGFFIGSLIGFVLGVLVSQVGVLYRLLYPYVVAFQTVPKVAIAPLVVIWFGFGLGSKVAMALMICFFPVVVNTIEGLHAVNPERIMLLRSYSASRWDIFRIVQLPAALPFIFAGLDIGIVLAVIGTVVGEFVGSTAGLGYLLMKFNHEIDIAGVFATIVVLSVMGVVLHAILRLIQQRVVFWSKPGTTIGA
jgi:NitT/TauT family transport system permease protein